VRFGQFILHVYEPLPVALPVYSESLPEPLTGNICTL
jgi:hypothetical protein